MPTITASSDELAVLRQEIASKIAFWTREKQDMITAIPGLVLYKRTAPVSEACKFTEPGLALVVQGRKQVDLGNKKYTYDESRFLLKSIQLPTVDHVLDASITRPYLMMVLHFDMTVAQEIVAQFDLHSHEQKAITRAVGTGTATKEVLSAYLRLVSLLDTPDDIPFVAPLLHRELLYRLLRTEDGTRLRQAVSVDSPMNRVAMAVNWIKENFQKPLHIQELADVVHVGVSTLHHNFRAVTAMSPLQYQKCMRLYEARKLLILTACDVSTAAASVGYGSVNQFAREYKRLFGRSPKRDMKDHVEMSSGV